MGKFDGSFTWWIEGESLLDEETVTAYVLAALNRSAIAMSAVLKKYGITAEFQDYEDLVLEMADGDMPPEIEKEIDAIWEKADKLRDDDEAGLIALEKAMHPTEGDDNG